MAFDPEAPASSLVDPGHVHTARSSTNPPSPGIVRHEDPGERVGDSWIMGPRARRFVQTPHLVCIFTRTVPGTGICHLRLPALTSRCNAPGILFCPNQAHRNRLGRSRPVTFKTTVIRKIKRPGGIRRWPAYATGDDDFGLWLFSPKGTIFRASWVRKSVSVRWARGTKRKGCL